MLPKKAQNSQIMDMLLRMMPELRDFVPGRMRNQKTDPKFARSLYDIWSDEGGKLANNKFRRPKGVTVRDVGQLEAEGLVTSSGDDVVITKKGGDVLRQMILGDDRSSFDHDGRPIEYLKALANLKPSRQRKYGKMATAAQARFGRNWYTNFTDALPPA